MASTGYTAWAVTAGEQPTTAYWNILGTNDASFNNGQGFNDGIILSRHLTSAIQVAPVEYNPYKWFISLTGSVQTGTGGFFNAALDTAIVDTSNSFNATTHQISVPTTGLYNLSGGIGYAGSTSGQHHIVGISKSGTEYIRFYEGTGDTANNVFSGAVSMIPLTAGDLLSLEGYSLVNLTMMADVGTAPTIAHYTWFSGILVSKT